MTIVAVLTIVGNRHVSKPPVSANFCEAFVTYAVVLLCQRLANFAYIVNNVSHQKAITREILAPADYGLQVVGQGVNVHRQSSASLRFHYVLRMRFLLGLLVQCIGRGRRL
jgi:hypothetical protein